MTFLLLLAAAGMALTIRHRALRALLLVTALLLAIFAGVQAVVLNGRAEKTITLKTQQALLGVQAAKLELRANGRVFQTPLTVADALCLNRQKNAMVAFVSGRQQRMVQIDRYNPRVSGLTALSPLQGLTCPATVTVPLDAPAYLRLTALTAPAPKAPVPAGRTPVPNRVGRLETGATPGRYQNDQDLPPTARPKVQLLILHTGGAATFTVPLSTTEAKCLIWRADRSVATNNVTFSDGDRRLTADVSNYDAQVRFPKGQPGGSGDPQTCQDLEVYLSEANLNTLSTALPELRTERVMRGTDPTTFTVVFSSRGACERYTEDCTAEQGLYRSEARPVTDLPKLRPTAETLRVEFGAAR